LTQPPLPFLSSTASRISKAKSESPKLILLPFKRAGKSFVATNLNAGKSNLGFCDDHESLGQLIAIGINQSVESVYFGLGPLIIKTEKNYTFMKNPVAIYFRSEIIIIRD